MCVIAMVTTYLMLSSGSEWSCVHSLKFRKNNNVRGRQLESNFLFHFVCLFVVYLATISSEHVTPSNDSVNNELEKMQEKEVA
jgi:hypothetical protein